MASLGNRPKTGFKDTNNPVGAGNWTIRWGPEDFQIQIPFEVYHAAVKGPSGSTFQIYIDSQFYDNVNHGDINSWDPSQPMLLEKGQTVYYYYSVSTGTAPNAALYCRERTT